MSHKGKIYGLVGVIGGGKSYRAEQLQVDAACAERPMIMGDFSEGIRQTLMNIFLGKNKEVYLNGNAYKKWKETDMELFLPFFEPFGKENLATTNLNGRELLQHTGEFLKTLAGEDVWARWTSLDVLRKWVVLPDEQAHACDIVFGSLRFDCEAEALFQVAASTNKEVEIIFCNFKSDRYEIANHVSEHFAQYFLHKGCQDGENITELVKEKLHGRI